MFRRFLPVLGTAALLLVSPWRAGAQSTPSQATAIKHVWSNEDMDRLRAEGLISYFNAAPTENAPAQAAPSVAEATAPAPPPKLQDPAWYAQQAAALNAHLDQDQAALQQAQSALAQAQSGNTQPGINLAEGDPGVTPDSGIDNLQARVRDDEDALDQLGDLARQNGIEPGVLRS